MSFALHCHEFNGVKIVFGLHFQLPDEIENIKFASRRGKSAIE